MAGYLGQNMSWTPQQSDALRTHVAAGLSFAQSAAKINAEFGTAYSRNAAIGRANRLGMQCPQGRELRVEKQRIARKTNPRLRIVAMNGNSNHKRIIQSFEASEIEALKCVEIIPRGLSLIDLEPNDCRYPYGDTIITFCGHPKQDQSSYCPAHFGLTRGRILKLTDAQHQHRRQVHANKMRRRILQVAL